MRFRSLAFSAVALCGAGVGAACTDEARGVIEPPYTSVGGGGAAQAGSSTTHAGTSSKGGRSNSNGGSTGNQAGDAPEPNMGGGGPDSVGACELPWSEGTTGGDESCDLESLPDSGMKLTGDISGNLSLEGRKSYVLSGEVRVLKNATLTLAPCTKIIGEDKEALMVVMPGGKLEAVGEQDAPILFTSSLPKGSRAPGDWGGLMLLGNAQTNQATDIVLPSTEGLVKAESYGANNADHNDESSGSLVYVRVEFVGKTISKDSEVNGITFYGVGSGTRVSHVQVANCTDDCFEWFGGAVNADHLIALNCDDDSFDTDNGFSGHVQFAFGRQFPSTSEADSNGFEMDTANPFLKQNPDGTSTTNPVLPLTANQWSNVTLCGDGPEDALSPPRIGAVLRRRVSGSIVNTILTGFADGGVGVRDDSTIALTHSAIFDNGRDGTKVAYKDDQIGHVADAESENTTEAPAGFCDCWSDPPVPFPLQPLPGTTPTGFADEGASYIGAFKQADAASNWMVGKWVSWESQ